MDKWSNNLFSSTTTLTNVQQWQVDISLLSNFELLSMSNNPNLVTTPLSWINKFTTQQSLSLFHSQLTGELPPELYLLMSLTALRIYGTHLLGTILSQISDLTNLLWLWLHRNRLSNDIPSDPASLTNFEGLTLYGNNFTNNMNPSKEICKLTNSHSLQTYFVDCQQTIDGDGTKCLCRTKCFPVIYL